MSAVSRAEPAVPAAVAVARREATREPHFVLAVAAACILGLEWQRGSETLTTSWTWPLAQALVAGVALAAVWPLRSRLRLVPILAVGLSFHLAWLGVHFALGVAGDGDPLSVYPSQGEVVLNGDYPRSEYPPGAVALFAVAKLLGGETVRASLALLMVPFQLLCVAAVWSLRTRWSPWLAAVVALWPLNAFYWEFRFDLVPAAALLVGIAFAWRGRWGGAGLALGVGTVVKWTPALAAAVLLLWLVRSRQLRATAIHVAGFGIPLLAAYVPLLLWRPAEVLSAFTFHNARTITAESMMYLPLRLLYDIGPGYWYFAAADVPANLNRAVVLAQLVLVALVMALVVFARTRAAALAVAALAPAVFLLTNRIFSAQFFVVVLVALVVAAALVARRRMDVWIVAAAAAAGSTANTILFQSLLAGEPTTAHPGWTFISAAAFAPVAVATVALAVRALRPPDSTGGNVLARRAWGYVSRPAVAVVIGVVGAYAALRAPLLSSFPPFVDEATYARWAERGYESAADRFASLAAGKEPLLEWLAMGFLSVGAPPLTAVRLVSFVAGLATVVAIALVAHGLGGRLAALAASVVAALLPLFVVYQVVGTYEALATAVVAWALYLQIRLATEPRLDVALLLGLVFGAGLLTKQTTYVALALLPASLLSFDWRKPNVPRRFAAWIGGASLAVAVGYVAYSILKLSEFYDDLDTARESTYPTHSLATALEDPFRWLEANAEPYAAALIGYLTAPLVVAAVVGFVVAVLSRPRLAVFVALWAAAPVGLALLVAEYATPRYVVTVGPAVCVFAGLGVVAFASALRRRGFRTPVVAAATALLLVPAVVWNAKLVASPATVTYPGLDDADLARGWSAGAPWEELKRELLVRAGTFPTFTVVVDDQSVAIAELVLRTSGVAVVRRDSPDAATARFAVANAAPIEEPPNARAWIEIWRVERPRGGAPLVLYQSAVELDGESYATPDELRAGLGLSDPDFDAYLEAHPEIFEWYAAYYRDTGS